jgi:hypothetical protein
MTVLAVIAAVGGISFAQLPFPYDWIATFASATGGFCVILHKHRDVVLRFGNLTWTKHEICRHVLITGDTGSGKTTSGLQPILVQLTQNVPGWGGLVLGVKGDEHRFISELAEHHRRPSDVIHLQVRPPDASTKWKPPHRYNLVSDHSLPWMTHAKAVVDIAASVTEGTQHAFFRPMAQISIANAFELLEELGEIVTITRAYHLLTNPDLVAKALKKLRGGPETDKRRQLIAFFESTFTKALAHEQTEATIGTVKTYLAFFLDPDIAAVFSSEEPNTFSLAELDRGAIISVTMPQRLVTERRYVQTYLKTLFYYHALRRFDLSQEDQQRRNTLFLIADEFQDLVTSTEDGISDHKVFDRIRAANVGIIAAMQSEISADPAIGERKRRVLTLNMRTRFIFRSADQEGAIASADFIGKRQYWKKTRISKLFKAATISRTEQEEYRVKPLELMRLKDHKAFVVHPSKNFIRKLILPCDGKGRTLRWH